MYCKNMNIKNLIYQLMMKVDQALILLDLQIKLDQ
jgi:hypothetical protein